jgi:tetratricopeptide (TPR) repeat protein
MRNFTRAAIFSTLVLGLLTQARPANAIVIVLGNGMAQVCYEAALAISKGLMYIPPVTTGTRIDLPPAEICTAALQEGGLNLRDAAGTHVNRGVLLFIAGNYAASLQDFEHAIALDDSIGEAHANRGAALVAMKRWADSVPSITKGIELQAAEMEKSYYNRAIAHEELGNVKGAYLDYLKASEIRPEWEAPKMQLTRFTVRKKAQ